MRGEGEKGREVEDEQGEGVRANEGEEVESEREGG